MINRFNSQVTQGAILLDRNYPTWHRRIDTCQLLMSCPFLDILGQLYGEYQYGLIALFGLQRHKSYRYGFNTPVIRGDFDWVELREAWLDAILFRTSEVTCLSCN